MVVVTGGFVTTALGVRLSARSPIAALTGAACALGIWLVMASRQHALTDDLARVETWLTVHVRWIVISIAALAAGVAIAFNSFSATGSDASGYLSHTRMLLAGKLAYDEPLASIAEWPGGEGTLAPLGWSAIGHGLQVPTYSVGLPLLMAPFHAAGGAPAASLVVPLSFALLVVAGAALAYRMAGAGSASALIAAVWLATSPVALVESMQIMSDVPVTAAWLLCWWLVFCNRPLAGGVAAACAVLIRPNLAPLALLPALCAAIRSYGPEAGDVDRNSVQAFRRGAWRGLIFSIPVVAAGIITAYLQWRWFGSALRSGYGSAREIYALANVVPNARLYSQWLLETQGPWLMAAPFAAALPLLAGVSRRGQRDRLSARDVVFLLVFAAAVVVAYLAYAQFEVWTYLRFLLPALAVATIAVAAIVSGLLVKLPVALRVPVLALILLTLAAANITSARRLEVFRFAERHVRARVVGEQLAATLPVNAVIVSGEQSGAMRYYTGRTILRWDVMDEAAMREAVDRLTRINYHVWVVLDDWEEEPFRRALPALASAALDYEPVVESAAGVPIRTRAWRVRSLSVRSSNNE